MTLKIIGELIDNPRKTLRAFALGALLFFIGIGTIQFANSQVTPSFEQELYALGGLIFAGVGFSIALTCQVFLIIHRFKKMGESEHR